MKTFEILYVKTCVEAYHVQANTETEAIKHIEDEFATEGDRITRVPHMDNTIAAHYQCEGEIK